MKSSNCDVKIPEGNLGGSSLTTCLSCSNGDPHESYGNLPVASSTSDIPKLHISLRTS